MVTPANSAMAPPAINGHDLDPVKARPSDREETVPATLALSFGVIEVATTTASSTSLTTLVVGPATVLEVVCSLVVGASVLVVGASLVGVVELVGDSVVVVDSVEVLRGVVDGVIEVVGVDVVEVVDVEVVGASVELVGVEVGGTSVELVDDVDDVDEVGVSEVGGATDDVVVS